MKKENSSKIFNIGLHVIILFTFLTIFFFVIIQAQIKHHIEELVHQGIEQNLGKTLKENIPISDLNINKDILYDIANKLENDETNISYIEENNKKILLTSIIIIILLFVFMVVFYYIYRKDLDIKELLYENILIFTLVGIIEILFFYKIGLKYIPLTPDIVNKTLIKNLSQKIKNI